MRRLVSVLPVRDRAIELALDDGETVELELVSDAGPLLAEAARTAIVAALEDLIDRANE